MRIGIDLGGSKIEIAVLGATGAEALRRRVATPAGDYPATVDAVAMRARTRMTEGVEMFAAPTDGPDPHDPEHAAKAVAWLCGADASDVTGRVLLVVGWKVSVVGPLAVTGRVDLDPDWSPADLTTARAELFGA